MRSSQHFGPEQVAVKRIRTGRLAPGWIVSGNGLLTILNGPQHRGGRGPCRRRGGRRTRCRRLGFLAVIVLVVIMVVAPTAAAAAALTVAAAVAVHASGLPRVGQKPNAD